MGKYSEEVKTKEQAAFLQPVHHAKSHMRLCGFDISRHSNAHRFRAVVTLGGGQFLADQLTLSQTEGWGKIMPTTLRRPPTTHTPDFQTLQRP